MMKAWKEQARLWYIPVAAAAFLVLVIVAGIDHVRHEREWRFVRQALLASEDADSRHQIVRWLHPFSLTVTTYDTADHERVRALAEEINRVLDGTRVTIAFDPTMARQVKVVFAPLKGLKAIAAGAGSRFNDDTAGKARLWFDQRARVTRGQILIESNLFGDERVATIAHELMHVLGAWGHTSEFRESALYQTGHETSDATHLSAVDRKLLRFLYIYLWPGDDAETVRREFDRHWDSIPPD